MTTFVESDFKPKPTQKLRAPNPQKSPAPRECDPGMAQFCRLFGLPVPTAEYRFCPERRWRADYAWVEQKVILEVEGGVWTRGRHTRGAGFLGDLEKYNWATIMGYRLLRVTPQTLRTAATAEMIRLVLKGE